jgi:hypothetical protein
MGDEGFVKFTFWAPGRVASPAEIVGGLQTSIRPDFPLWLFNLTMPAASLFAFSARFEICRDDRIVGRAKAQIADESGIP